MSPRLKTRLAVLILLFFIASLLAYISLTSGNKQKLTVAFLNIGQGDAIFIDSPSGNQILIDGGPSRSVLRELGKVMPFYDKSIDVVIATHPDSDHISGLNDVLDKFKVDLFIEPGVEGDTGTYAELKNRVIAENAKTIEARRGMIIDLGDGAVLQILYPTLNPDGMETNTASIVARLVYGESEFLLTGDSPENIEKYLVNLESKAMLSSVKPYESLLDSDVLKAGHHGSKTSTSEEFVSAVSPKYAVISSGKDNRYGHPHKEVLDSLTKFGSQILRTDEVGRIVFESDGVNLRIK